VFGETFFIHPVSIFIKDFREGFEMSGVVYVDWVGKGDWTESVCPRSYKVIEEFNLTGDVPVENGNENLNSEFLDSAHHSSGNGTGFHLHGKHFHLNVVRVYGGEDETGAYNGEKVGRKVAFLIDEDGTVER